MGKLYNPNFAPDDNIFIHKECNNYMTYLFHAHYIHELTRQINTKLAGRKKCIVFSETFTTRPMYPNSTKPLEPPQKLSNILIKQFKSANQLTHAHTPLPCK